MDCNGGGVGQTDKVVRIGRECENGRLVGFGNRVVDGLERDRDGGLAEAHSNNTAKRPVIPGGRLGRK